jgi:hypothetical protein
MDRAIHTPTAQQRGVGRVDNGVHFLARDVPFDDLDAREFVFVVHAAFRAGCARAMRCLSVRKDPTPGKGAFGRECTVAKGPKSRILAALGRLRARKERAEGPKEDSPGQSESASDALGKLSPKKLQSPGRATQSFNLSPAVQTTKYTKYTKAERDGPVALVPRWVNDLEAASLSIFVSFVCFVVPTALFRFDTGFACIAVDRGEYDPVNRHHSSPPIFFRPLQSLDSFWFVTQGGARFTSRALGYFSFGPAAL